MPSVNITDLRKELSRQIEDLEPGANLEVTKGGEVVAYLVHPDGLECSASPVSEPQRPSEPASITLLRNQIIDAEAHPEWVDQAKKLPAKRAKLARYEESLVAKESVSTDPDGDLELPKEV